MAPALFIQLNVTLNKNTKPKEFGTPSYTYIWYQLPNNDDQFKFLNSPEHAPLSSHGGHSKVQKWPWPSSPHALPGKFCNLVFGASPCLSSPFQGTWSVIYGLLGVSNNCSEGPWDPKYFVIVLRHHLPSSLDWHLHWGAKAWGKGGETAGSVALISERHQTILVAGPFISSKYWRKINACFI